MGISASDVMSRLERERIHLLLIEDAVRGLADIVAGRTAGADSAIAQLQERRASASTSPGFGLAQPRGRGAGAP